MSGQNEQSANFDSNAAFADAIARARQIAAKIQAGGGAASTTSGGDSVLGGGGGVKRSIDDEGPDYPKKMAVSDGGGSYGGSMSPPMSRPMGGSSSGNLSNVVVDEWKVPDHMVGLIIGRGGEQINRIQAESGCKVQMAAASEGSSERTCTLTGTQQAIEKCKELLAQIINGESRGPRGGGMGGSRFGGRNGGGPNNSSEHTLEMMIPAGKAGLVIGKGGETIRNLQNQAGVKMVIVQGGNDGNNIDKPLKITGEPQQCEYAKQLVMDLLAEKDMDRGQGGGRGRGTFEGNRPGFGRGRGRDDVQEHRLNVPANQCGRIIGKGGDYIRYISQTSGAHIELSRGPQPSPTEKTFIIRGNPQQIDHAQHLIHEKINDSPQFMRGGDQPPSGQQQPAQWDMGGYQPQQQQPQQQQQQQQGSWPVSQPVVDPSKQQQPSQQQQDPNAAAWAAYYAQYYSQQQQQYQQQSSQPQQQPQQQTPAAQQPTPAPAAAQSTPSSTNPAASGGGTQDYSAAWIQYYRSMGMFKEAEAIENQMRNQSGGGASGSQQNYVAPQQQQQQQPAQPAATTNGGSNWPGNYQPQQQQPAQPASAGYPAGGAYSNYPQYSSPQQQQQPPAAAAQ